MLNPVRTSNKPFQYFFKCYELQYTLEITDRQTLKKLFDFP